MINHILKDIVFEMKSSFLSNELLGKKYKMSLFIVQKLINYYAN